MYSKLQKKKQSNSVNMMHIARVLSLVALKFVQNASTRRMLGCAHGNKSGAY